jgi:ABC-type glycerol-3-phosphate transport system substrate-binding protein
VSPRLKIPTIFVVLILLLSGCSMFSRPTPTPEPVTIHFSFIGNLEAFTALAQEFNTLNPHITVELDEITRFTNNFNETEARADVIRVMPFIGRQITDADFLPLGDLLSLSQLLSPAEFFPGSLEALQVAGEQMGIPAGISQVVMFYSILRFKIAGVEPPPPNWDLNDFINLATVVQKQGKIPDTSGDEVYGFCTSPNFDDSVYFTYLFGGKLFDHLPNPTRPTLNLTQNADAIKWYASLQEEYQITQPLLNTRQQQAYQDISGYKCGFWINIMELPMFMNMREEDVGFLPLPKSTAGINIATLESYHILKSSSHPLEAWQWIEFLVTHPISAGSVLPSLPKQLSDPDFLAHASSVEIQIIDQLNEDTIFLTMEFYQDPVIIQVLDQYSKAVQQVMYEQVDVQAALDAAQADAETVFANQPSP